MSTSSSRRRFSDSDIEKSIQYAAEKLGFVDGFREQQQKSLHSFIRGHDLFISLPTGFGKSVVFQAAPLCVDFLRKLHDGPDSPKAVALVVMPLKSLISDQMSRAMDLGLIAGDLSSGLNDPLREGMASGVYSILFASPESLLEDDSQEIITLLKDQICGIFVDESHCVTKWETASGDTRVFRAAYGKLGEFRSKLKSSVPAVALTATATVDVRNCIIENLGLRNYVWVNQSPDKQNIKHVVIKSATRDLDTMFKWLADDLKIHGASCERMIIYCQSRKMCSDVYATFMALLPEGCHRYVNMYHRNTETDIQKKIVDNMSAPDGEIRVLVATIAYGLGVDVSNVHSTVLCGRPSDLDDYIQLSGRIGRDGKQSTAVTLCYPGDSAGRKTTSPMQDFLGGKECRRAIIKAAFGDTQPNSISHNCCDVCATLCQWQFPALWKVALDKPLLKKCVQC
ncbi:ATP-dependent helicase wrn-1-like [Diadema setosum]|uniref:ATP-dependent helicase wrn-1-like n=1 Tax=Diadema setosum TaxID=31175 RepID=UPI003B3BBFE8